MLFRSEVNSINATLKELTSSTIHDVPSNVSSNVPVNKKYDPLSAIDKNDTSISSNTLQVPDDHTYESSDQILDFTDSFMGDLIDGFMIYYKSTYKKPDAMNIFSGIDINDPTSINNPLAEFYTELTKFTTNNNINPEKCNVVTFDDNCAISKTDIKNIILTSKLGKFKNMYIYYVIAHDKLMFASLSLMAILIHMASKYNNKNYKILSLHL